MKFLSVFLLLMLASAAVAQPAADSVLAWSLVVDGRAEAWPGEGRHPADSLEALAAGVLRDLQRSGHFLATVDSARLEGSEATLYASRGPRLEVAALEVEGMEEDEARRFLTGFRTRPGAPLDPDDLERDLADVLVALERRGLPLASVALERAEVEPEGLRLVLRLERGPTAVLGGVELVPAGRTAPAFAARTAGLEPGAPLRGFDPAAIRRDLEDTGLFEAVGEPELVLGAEGAVTVRVPAEEAPPGSFDLVLGYLPGSGDEGGALVGDGSLVLRNLFGHGRALHLELLRNPGLASSFELAVSDPFVLGLPLRLEARFSGHQQDSTFQQQRYGLEAGYRVAPGLELLARGSRERVEAGVAGAAVVEGRARIPASSAWFAGLGVRFRRVDRPLNPRRGLRLEMMLEQGVKERTFGAGSAAAEEPVTVGQQRLAAEARAFVPTFRRQVLVLGGDAALLLGDVYDESDLFRFGGARSLRGYEEDRFRGHIVGRATAEYRYQLDPTSFAFAFVDVGYLRRPALPETPAAAEVRPGYGLGLQYRTPLGLVTVSYALNPEIGLAGGNVHVGLSVGL